MSGKAKTLLFIIAVVLCVSKIFLVITEPEMSREIKALTYGSAIKKVEIEYRKNNLNPAWQEADKKIDNTIITITLKKNALTDDELDKLVEEVQLYLNTKIPDAIDSESGNLIRINLGFSPLSDDTSYITDNQKPDGMSYYRQFNNDTLEFEWSGGTYKLMPTMPTLFDIFK